ncbi:MAG: acyl-CoA dehydrogenase family protein [Acidimicrobiia bacterium]
MGTSSRLFPGAKVMIAAQAVGIAQAAFELSVDFARARVQGGKPVIRHQAVGMRLADMAIRIETTRAFVHQTARAIDRGDPNRRALMFMAKVAGAETVFDVCTKVLEIHGGLGAMREGRVEKLLRDAALFFHLDGTNDIHRFRTLKELFPGETGDYAG